MTEDERRRYLAGRDDWREGDWGDHCGQVDCGHPGGCCQYWVPDLPVVAGLRQRFLASILGAEVEKL